MIIDELRENRYNIIAECLQKGIHIPYMMGWSLYMAKGILYQTIYNKEKRQQITHKSVVSLQSFISFCENIGDKSLKDLYGTLKLTDLQNKLMGKEG